MCTRSKEKDLLKQAKPKRRKRNEHKKRADQIAEQARRSEEEKKLLEFQLQQALRSRIALEEQAQKAQKENDLVHSYQTYEDWALLRENMKWHRIASPELY